MAGNRTKLKLTWLGKEHRPKLEPLLSVEATERSYHAARRIIEARPFERYKETEGRTTN